MTDLIALCESVDLPFHTALWLADLPTDRRPDELTPDEVRKVEGCIRFSGPDLSDLLVDRPLPSNVGMCSPIEITPEQAEINAVEMRRMVRWHALWDIAVNLRSREQSGPSLFDDEAPEDPLIVLQKKRAEWKALDADPTQFQLAWCVGAFRALGVELVWQGGKPVVLPHGHTELVTGPLLAALRPHRPAVVERLSAGLPFDCPEWQLILLKPYTDWPVWGYRVAEADGMMSLRPVLVAEVPPFYDAVQPYRPDCWRAVPAEAVAAVRASKVGRRLPRGGVYLGPPTADRPKGWKDQLHEESKIRKRHGLTNNSQPW